MELFYFRREAEDVTRDYCSAHCFFIPNKNVLFVNESVNGVNLYALVTDENIVDEARVLYQGKDPYERERNGVIETVGTPSFSNTRKIEVPNDKIHGIVDALRNRDSFEKKAREGIEDILKEIPPR